MPDADAVTLSVRMDRSLAEALSQIAGHTGRSADELISEAVAAAITSAPQLKLEALGQPMSDGHEPEPFYAGDAKSLQAALSRFRLPEHGARLMLGDEVMERLIGSPAGAPFTVDAGARLAAVTAVCQLLQGGYTDAGVRRWWTKSRNWLRGAAPVDVLPPGWTPDTAAFRAVRALAESDAGFVAT